MKTLLKKIFGSLLKNWEIKKVVDELYFSFYENNATVVNEAKCIASDAIDAYRTSTSFDIPVLENTDGVKLLYNLESNLYRAFGIWATRMDNLCTNKIIYLISLLDENNHHKTLLQNWVNNCDYRGNNYLEKIDFMWGVDLVSMYTGLAEGTTERRSSTILLIEGQNCSLPYLIKNLKESLES